jgi:hypothetical protein
MIDFSNAIFRGGTIDLTGATISSGVIDFSTNAAGEPPAELLLPPSLK